jgi:predicted O-methyltransferase YrrM
VPVALLIFNRPQLTAQVLDILRQVRPVKLLVVADGPRSHHPGEAALCQQTRDIIEQVDWPCQILRHYADENLGCRRRVASGLDWVFSQVERAIILEDDCLPDPSFFQFCEELLDRYSDDDRVMAISGDNFQGDRPVTDDSYYFSRYPHIWGWATWRRAWQHYDLAMTGWPSLRDSGWLNTLFDDPVAAAYWTRIFQLAYDGFDTWDYALVFACWVKQGLVALPNKNLVTNIGFGQDATHTRNHSPLANLPVEPITFPLGHPQKIVRNVEADNYTEKTLFSQASQANNLSLSSQKIDTTKVMLHEIHKKILTSPHNSSYYTELSQSLEKANRLQAAQRALEQSWSIEWGEKDYVSPGCKLINADPYFPHLTLGDRLPISWPYLRKEVPHNWYVDQRSPYVGFLSRDEAHLLHNIALEFSGKPVLEIGCWMGWSACHLALANVQLDVIDPLLSKPEIYQTVSESLTAAGVRDQVNLVAGYSPQAVQELAVQKQHPWSLIFIDGNHDRPAPLEDTKTCIQFAATDAAIVFHDLASPEVTEGLEYLRQQGWNTMVYQTMQIMGIAWRGQVNPVRHIPDPRVNWTLPNHLQSFMVSGVSDNRHE